MLPDELPLRDPLENPPPDPPRAFAKDTVGTPTRDNARHAAMSLVVFKAGSLSLDIEINHVPGDILPGMGEENLRFVRRCFWSISPLTDVSVQTTVAPSFDRGSCQPYCHADQGGTYGEHHFGIDRQGEGDVRPHRPECGESRRIRRLERRLDRL